MAQQLSCRICLEPGEREELIAPCSCRGTSKYVHPECLHTWRYLHPARASQCTTCGASFLIRLDPETSPSYLSSMYIRMICCTRAAIIFILSLLPTILLLWLIYYDVVHNYNPPIPSPLQLILIIYCNEWGKAVIREMYRFGGYTSGCLFVPDHGTMQEVYESGHCMLVIVNCTIFLPVHVVVGFLTMVLVVTSMPFYVTAVYSSHVSTTEQLRSTIGRVEDLSDNDAGLEVVCEAPEYPIFIPAHMTATVTTSPTSNVETLPLLPTAPMRTYNSTDSHV